jgi:hypothetical protein
LIPNINPFLKIVNSLEHNIVIYFTFLIFLTKLKKFGIFFRIQKCKKIWSGRHDSRRSGRFLGETLLKEGA